VITLRTNAPFPVPDDNVTPELVPDGAPPIAGYKPSDTDVVQLRVCSELISYSAPLKAFETSEKLGLVVDGKGQPMALSIGEDRVRNLPISSTFADFKAPSITLPCKWSTTSMADARYHSSWGPNRAGV
jgi:hypothetical protein